jgi:3-oxoacyl-[acyl-carrier-protein] synthase II
VSTNSRRIVVTGLGLVCPCGNTVEESWENILSGRSGIDKISAFDASEYDSQIAGEVKGFDPHEFMEKKDARRADRSVQLAVAAATEAMSANGLDSVEKDRFGAIIGSGIGGIQTFEEQHTVLIERGPSRISPFFIPMMISDMAAGQVSIKYGLKGPNFGTVSACASGGHALSDAFMYIKNGLADIMVAGGTEATISPMALGGFCSLKALSTRNDDPTHASRPFDIDRDGFVMSEGAGIIILEELEHAKSRGATILAEMIGVGLTGDAFHMTQPPPGHTGAVAAMRMALEYAGLETGDVDYINAHGTSTFHNDKNECEAIRTVFGPPANGLKVSSTKSVTGHLLGAAAALEFIVCVKALIEGIIPPTANLENPDPDCELNHVTNGAEKAELDIILSNSFGFGGHNVALILKKYQA